MGGPKEADPDPPRIPYPPPFLSVRAISSFWGGDFARKVFGEIANCARALLGMGVLKCRRLKPKKEEGKGRRSTEQDSPIKISRISPPHVGNGCIVSRFLGPAAAAPNSECFRKNKSFFVLSAISRLTFKKGWAGETLCVRSRG